ncbi:methylmalonyl-CoA mutase family protein [Streptomyces sp. NPDC091287]|uniref:methylmalonyl-CoA mutase family protein n=1 Tax=Streptomyces sp. NPDC091287 TaxID=3365988 RepID=UPI0037F187D1
MARESNARYRRLIENGATDLSVAFDLPTRTGHDSDSGPARGRVGGAGVAIDSIDDMRVLFDAIPLDRVSATLESDATAAPLLLLYQLVGEEQGIEPRRLTGTVHNDVLTEHIVEGDSIFPPGPALRLTADILRYAEAELPRWNTVSVSAGRLAGAGASPAQEIAFTLANGIEYIRTAVAAGLDADGLVTRLSFTYAAPGTSRAAHRIWAQALRKEFGVRIPGPDADGVPAAGPAVGIVETALELMSSISELGGAARAVEQGFQRGEIAPHERSCVLPLPGAPKRLSHHDGALAARQAERLAKLRAWRCHERVGAALTRTREAAEGTANVLHPMKDALAAGATVGEVCDVLREVWVPGYPGMRVREIGRSMFSV